MIVILLPYEFMNFSKGLFCFVFIFISLISEDRYRKNPACFFLILFLEIADMFLLISKIGSKTNGKSTSNAYAKVLRESDQRILISSRNQ